MHTRTVFLFYCLFSAILALMPASLLAQNYNFAVEQPYSDLTTPPLQNKETQQVFESDNTIIHADNLTYLSAEKIVMAEGNVEISQGGRILLANKLTYNQLTNIVEAVGDVSLLDTDGNVYFAQQVNLKDDLKQGVINNFSARLKDNSLFASNTATLIDEKTKKLEYAVFSGCKVCEGYADEEPLWQISAEEVIIDDAEQIVTYDNAFFEFFGVPILYTPYLSHATPGADRKSGFLIPSYRTINTLGTTIQTPYYVDIAPNMDATITPIITTREGLVMSGEFRHLTENGYYQLFGSITNPDERDESGNKTSDKDIRGHIEGFGDFNIGNDWQAGFDIKRSTDDTYLQRYKFGNEDLLTSTAYIQKFENKNYIKAETISFQGLNADDDPDTTPLILPIVNSHFESEPGWRGSKWVLDGNLLALHRSEGIESRRLSVTGGWEVPIITENGQLLEIRSTVRADGYDVENVPDPLNSNKDQEGLAGRVIPQLELNWSYPLVRQGETISKTFFEPVVQLIASPYGGNPDKIPNEDSQEIEISDVNLFTSNQIIGLDRIDGGPRTNYGFRGSMQKDDLGIVDFVFGQSYRTKTDAIFTPESGLDDNFSDYVGRIGIKDENKYLDLNYLFRFDKENFDARRTEVSNASTFGPLSVNLNYLLLNEGPLSNPSFNREEIRTNAKLKLTEFWSVNGAITRDLSDSEAGFISGSTGIVFDNECLNFSLQFKRDFTSDRDIEPSKALVFQIILKNLN